MHDGGGGQLLQHGAVGGGDDRTSRQRLHPHLRAHVPTAAALLPGSGGHGNGTGRQLSGQRAGAVVRNGRGGALRHPVHARLYRLERGLRAHHALLHEPQPVRCGHRGDGAALRWRAADGGFGHGGLDDVRLAGDGGHAGALPSVVLRGQADRPVMS